MFYLFVYLGLKDVYIFYYFLFIYLSFIEAYRKMNQNIILKILFVSGATCLPYSLLNAQSRAFPYTLKLDATNLWWLGISIVFIAMAVLAFLLKGKVAKILNEVEKGKVNGQRRNRYHLDNLNVSQIKKILAIKKKGISILFLFSMMFPLSINAQSQRINVTRESLFAESPVIITIVLILIPIILSIIFLFIKIKASVTKVSRQEQLKEAKNLASYLKSVPLDELEGELDDRQKSLSYTLSHDELSGKLPPRDDKGLLTLKTELDMPVVAVKKKAIPRPQIDPKHSKMIVWYIISATIWLIFGTSVGEYIGLKFVAPELDSISWLSFGRLRPVHTNVVFWGWSSLGMLGLAYYVVPRVSNVKLYSLKLGWYSLHLINASVFFGTISLMAGINNGGGEYREYIWPIMLLFGIALGITLINFLKTIAQRKTREIYISNWYIVSAIIFTIVIALVAYIPFWQDGLGETIVQGYYMHQGVGMWFMLFTLGLVYYFLPQQLNQPIYSYSLGVLAFWTQILFYTLIGTHHFIFSAIPWWLQTVAIVGSAGMIIPVVAGTTNFLMTFKGAWFKIKDSYTLPFFLVGIIFYFTGSMQGTAEAFRSTNLFWHFTDFTVAHSHLTMYGIICFLIWGGIYAILPRLSGQEAPQITVGAHFWLALIGLLFYTVPLMYGSTLKGMLWIEGKPFIDSVTFMAPYWLWRAIGGSLMWASHIFFAYNVYKMVSVKSSVNIVDEALAELEKEQL